MKLKTLKAQNFRLLKNLSLDIEKDLSLVIGKNNSGKTSFISLLDKFLNSSNAGSAPFFCDDFNLDYQKLLKTSVDNNQEFEVGLSGISLKLFIEYDENDDLANLSNFMMDLNPDNRIVVLGFEYSLHVADYERLKDDFQKFKVIHTEKIEKKYSPSTITEEEEKKAAETMVREQTNYLFYDFFKKEFKRYFKIIRKSIMFDVDSQKEDESVSVDFSNALADLNKLICLKIIHARRDVSNKENDKTLSTLSSKYYERKEGNNSQSPAIQKFKETLYDTDKNLDIIYQSLFKGIVDKVSAFGGLKAGESVIRIISTLQHKELLKGNTTVMYDHNFEHSLPENYNGLGYMNLIGIIFEIEVILTEFRKEMLEGETPADINILIVEEPEAHTHPQMQYSFIRNIKNILTNASKGDNGKGISFNLQTIITTHSSHITAESDFNDIKFFYRRGVNHVEARNLRELENDYKEAGEIEAYKFLKQYLTLNRAELFFADKAIFIEGDTERILLPAMMKKLDQKDSENPLLSQNISIVEVGAYSQVFEKFINFIGVKSLIITDLDSAEIISTPKGDGSIIKTREACRVASGSVTTNAALKFFHNDEDNLNYYVALPISHKILRKKPATKKWVSNRKGKVMMVYQVPEVLGAGSYHARSFEDCFFHINKILLVNPKHEFQSLRKKWLKQYTDETIDSYEFADKAVTSKPTLAMEILLNSVEDQQGNKFSNWKIPTYIQEGLEWLKKD